VELQGRSHPGARGALKNISAHDEISLLALKIVIKNTKNKNLKRHSTDSTHSLQYAWASTAGEGGGNGSPGFYTYY